MTNLILDIGTSSVRALLCNNSAQIIPETIVSIPHEPNTHPVGASTFDPEKLRLNVERCIDQVLSIAHSQTIEIQAVGMATFVGNVLGLKRDEAITPIYTYADTRSADHVSQLKMLLDEQALWKRTGCPLHTAYLPGRLRWLKETQLEQFQAVEKWVDIATYLYGYWFNAYRNMPSSYSVSSWSGMLNRASLQWEKELLDQLGLQKEQFPSLDDYDQPMQGLASQYADRWTALRDVPFFLAVGDGAAANVGSGCVDPNHIALTIGTTAALRLISPETLPPVPDGLWSYRVKRELHLIGGATSEGGNIFAWIRENLHLDGRSHLEDLLLNQRTDQHGLVFLPLLAGERSPGWRGDAAGGLIGMRLSTTALDIVQAALEGVAIRISLIADQFQHIAADDAVIFGGGGALLKSKAWAQMIADAVNRPVHLLADQEITARGVAILVSHALGQVRLDEIPPQISQIVNPRRENVDAMQAARERQVDLYKRLYG
jgi:gluconokinase